MSVITSAVRIAAVAMLLLFAAGVVRHATAQAPDSALVAAFVAHRLPLAFEGGALQGAGGALLLREAAASQFTLVGEEHGVREVPMLVQHLLAGLRPAGYRHFAIEVSPLNAERAMAAARAGGGRAAFDALFADTMSWMAFYTMPPETDLLAWAASPDAGGYDVWGLDYDVMGDRLALRRLQSIAPAPARARVADAIALADSGFAAVRRGDPSRLFSFTAPDSVFTGLRSAVGPAEDDEAARILDVLQTTASINRDFVSGRNYESNVKRAGNLKANFLRYYRAAEAEGEAAPRVLLKFGAYHMERGLNGVRQYDVGWLAAALAEANGGRSLHVLVMGGPDTERAQFDIMSLTYKPQPVEMIAEEWMRAPREAVLESGYTVYDLRPIRALIQNGGLRDVPRELERAVFGFDVMVVLTGSGPAVE